MRTDIYHRYYNQSYIVKNALDLGYSPEKMQNVIDLHSFIDSVLCDLYARGFSLRQIENMLELSSHSVRAHLLRMGVKLRSRGGDNTKHEKENTRKGLECV